MAAKDLVYWDRGAGRAEVERVYGQAWLQWAYGTRAGRGALRWLTAKTFSRLYGLYQDSPLSARKIPRFIRDYGIPMEQFEGAPFGSFNDFFIRRFKPGARRFVPGPADFPAFAEARLLAFENIRADQVFPVKAAELSAEKILGGELKARPFIGGPLLLARLCPVDYHRFHYPDDGETLESYELAGRLHSVNPAALAFDGGILATNQRRVSLLKTRGFGLLAYVEVGALCVGRIVQTHPEARPFERGAEKGYFLFGGSTVIVLGEPGAWMPDSDLLEQTALKRETLVRLGEKIASAL